MTDGRTARTVLSNPYVTLVLLASLWSSAFTAIKVGVETMPPTSLVAGRLLVAALLLLAFAAFRGRMLPPWGRDWSIYFALGAAGYGIPFFLIRASGA